MKHRALDLVVFDLGGVLVRIASTWDDACGLAGLHPPGDDSERFLAASDALLRDYQLGALTTRAYFEAVAVASDGTYAPDEVELVLHAWSQRQIDGVERIFDALDDAGIATAVLSNTCETHWNRLAALDGGNPEYPAVLRAGHRFASHLLGVMKPDLRAYAAVLEATGAEPSRVMFFDDVEGNVQGARTAGWHAEKIDPAGDTPAQILEHLRRFGVVAT